MQRNHKADIIALAVRQSACALLLVSRGLICAYLYGDGQLRPITQDHTVTEEMVRKGAPGQTRWRGIVFATSSQTSSAARRGGVKVEAHALESRPAIAYYSVGWVDRRW